jgi:hypothetical protein
MAYTPVEMTVRHEYDPEPPNFVEIERYIVDLNAIDYIYLRGINGVTLYMNNGKVLELLDITHEGIREILREHGRLE